MVQNTKVCSTILRIVAGLPEKKKNLKHLSKHIWVIYGFKILLAPNNPGRLSPKTPEMPF